MKPRRLRATIVHRNTDQQILRPIFRVLDKYVEVAVLIEDSGIKKFIFKILPGPVLVGFDQIQIWEFALRILVEVLHVGVRGGAVDIEVVLLHVFAVIAFAVGKPEETLLQDGIPLIPQRERETEPLAVVRDPGETIFSPSISTRPRLVMRKVVPGIAIIAVIFANRPPLPFPEIGTPLLPGHMGLAGCIQTLLFRSFDELGFHGAISFGCSNGALAGFARALQARQDDASAGIRGQIAVTLHAIRPCHGCARQKFRWPQKTRAYLICGPEGKRLQSPSGNRLFWTVDSGTPQEAARTLVTSGQRIEVNDSRTVPWR